MKNLLAITTAGQLRWLEEAISTLRDPLDVLVIDDATPGDEIRDFCGRKGLRFITKVKPMGLTNSWNKAYQYFKEHNYDNCILSNDDVRFPQGFSEGIFKGLEEFDLMAPLTNEPGVVWDSIHSPAHQEIRRYADININERDIDRVQAIISKRYRKTRQANFINGFCFAFSRSIGKFTFDKQFLFNPANINTWNEYDLAERISRKGGKIGICKTSYVFHWKAKTTEKLNRYGVVSGDYRNQLWRKEEVKKSRVKGHKIKIGGILPHLGMYGGVRIFLELGNVFAKRGIDYTLFVDKPGKCDWLDFNGKIEDWSNIEADYIIIGDTPSFRVLPQVKGKVFVWVIAGGQYLEGYKSVYGKYPFIIQNRAFLEYFPEGNLIEGGVNTEWFYPRKRKVLFYDDPRPFKGAAYIKEQLGDLENVKLVGLKGLSNKGIAEAYRKGDYFVVWESRQGWSGTGAQAVASGLTVVTNGVNCEPFNNRIIVVNNLREFFADPMKEFSWERVADKLLEVFKEGKITSTRIRVRGNRGGLAKILSKKDKEVFFRENPALSIVDKLGSAIKLNFQDMYQLFCHAKRIPNNGSYLEIGSAFGGSILCVYQATKSSGSSVDFTAIDPFIPYLGAKRMPWRKEDFLENTKDVPHLKFINSTSDIAKDKIDDNSIDLLFIDGDHDYKQVKRDIENYWPKVKTGGVMLGHDYVNIPSVRKAVNEIFTDKQKYPQGFCVLENSVMWMARKV